MKRLVLHSWLLLLYFDWIMHWHKFSELHRIVEEEPIRPTTSVRLTPYEDLSRAMDYACVLYFRRVLCLQRSSATAVLLRRHGWNAEMVIGAQMLPFKSHAWCEINGIVVNDKSYMHDIYEILERC
jgi:Transglutaminase-like superfamily